MLFDNWSAITLNNKIIISDKNVQG